MDQSTQIPKSHFHARSVSLPPRFHPLFISLFDELEKLKQWKTPSSPTSQMICDTLSDLGKVYECLHEALHLPQSQQSLSKIRQKKFMEESLDASVRLVDFCGMARELLSNMKEKAWDLQSTLRTRKGGDHGVNKKIQAYICLRKKTRKEIKKCQAALKQIDNNDVDSPLFEEDYHVQMLVNALREVRSISIVVLKSFFSWISQMKQKPKASRWSLVKMVVQKGKAVEWEGQEKINEVERVEHALFSCLPGCQAQKMEDVKMKLRDLEVCIRRLESAQECLFRRLVQTRVTLLICLTARGANAL